MRSTVLGAALVTLGACTTRDAIERPASLDTTHGAHTTRDSAPPKAPSAPDARKSTGLFADLDVTEGRVVPVDGVLRIDAPSVRAVLRGRTSPASELSFVYRGPTEMPVAMRSGAVRVQIGIKLRAADSCNVVYAMLRLEPEPLVVVQVKQNPGLHAHRECGNDGYRTLRPERFAKVDAVAPGSAHRLRAALRAGQLSVWFDGVLVWQGALDGERLGFDGPVGFRTDGGRFDIVRLEADGDSL